MGRDNNPAFPKLGGVDLLLGVEQQEQDPIPTSLPLTQIKIVKQPRCYFAPCSLQELADSIRQHGILQPLLVRVDEDGGYELVAGERRYRAALEVGLIEVPVYIRQLTQQQAWQFALLENLQRDGLNPVEETEGILQLIALHLSRGKKEVISLLHRMQHESKGQVAQNVLGSQEGKEIEQIFSQIGRLTWQSFVTTRLPLLNLPDDVLDVLRNGQIEYTKAKAIAKVSDLEVRQRLLQEAIEQGWSLSQIRERVKQISNKKPVKEQTEPNPLPFIQSLASRLNQAKLWEKQPQKWVQIQQKLQEIESLLEID